MILHLLKMVWNRKRTNRLIMLEIFLSFLVLFTVMAISVYYFNNYRLPLGYSWRNVWVIRADPKPDIGEVYVRADPGLQEKYRQVFLTIRSFNEVEGIAAAVDAPYDVRKWTQTFLGTRQFTSRVNEVSDGYKDVMNLQVVRGRWFEPADDSLNWNPVVITEKFAHMAFGDKDPLGMDISDTPRMRVVGVISEFRKDGEYSTPKPYVLFRRSLEKPAADILRTIVIKVKSGTDRSFEEMLMNGLNGVAKEWAFEVRPLEETREASLKSAVLSVKILALIDIFLMIMVALGLIGVLWQSVTRRTMEIGLRRAQGATAANIYLQIMGELFFIATMGLIPGILLIVQFPLLNLIGDLKISVYFYSIAISMLLIYLLTFICGLYPGWLATRIRPAEALHYE